MLDSSAERIKILAHGASVIAGQSQEKGGPMSGSERTNGVTDWERAEVEQANSSGKSPVVFVHGLWLLPSSWDQWPKLFEDNGYVTLAPGWPDDPRTRQEA